MKIHINHQIQDIQHYSCLCCGHGCRSFMVPVTDTERQTISDKRKWPAELGVKSLFIRTRKVGADGYALAKRENGDCVFLDEQNLCLIHKHYGLKAKPIACQLFPYVLTPVGTEMRVGLRFDCLGVCQGGGASVTDAKKELTRMAKHLLPNGIGMVPPPAIRPGHEVSVSRFDTINDVLLKIVSSNALSLADRMQWLRQYLDHIDKVKWDKLPDEDFNDIVNMLKGGSLGEIQDRNISDVPITGKPRKLFGQIFFLLSHPPEIITLKKNGFTQSMATKLKRLRIMTQLGRTSGDLPMLQPDWPQCNMADLEESYGEFPSDVEDFLERYLICRIGGVNYCGRNFYDYSLIEGARTLILAMVTIGWLMRIEALKAGRDQIELPDAHKAVITLDGNLGYGKALNTGPAKMRLGYLSGYLEQFIDWYCR